MKMRVWWIPQVPMKVFHVDVSSVEEGARLLLILADYDNFQFTNNVKPDYCSMGGLQVFDESDDTESPDGSWVDWCDEETGEDDPILFVSQMKH